MTQQKTLQMLPRFREHPPGSRTCPHQIAHRFVRGIGNPYRGELAGAVQLGQHHRIAAIRLDPVTRLHRDQRRRHDDAVVPATGQQTLKPIPARTGFIAEAQPAVALVEPGRQFAQDVRAVLENPDLPNLAAAPALGNCYANRRFVHIQPDIRDIVHSARPHA